MQINWNSNVDPVPKAGGSQPKTIKTDKSDQALFEQSSALDRALGSVPDVRADKVAYAKSLISDTHYPPQATMNGLANLLAMHLSDDSE